MVAEAVSAVEHSYEFVIIDTPASDSYLMRLAHSLADTLVSPEQFLIACRNAARLSQDPALPFRVGSSIHVSTYGMYGYAILCSTDFRRTFEEAKRAGLTTITVDPTERAELEALLKP